jgi:DNA-binding NarL/FixJ family response regulator
MLNKDDLMQMMLRDAAPPPPRKLGPAYWTREEIEDVRRMYLEGKTFKQIGRRMGRSRASIAGQIHRLKKSDLI